MTISQSHPRASRKRMQFTCLQPAMPDQHPLFKFEIIDRDAIARAVPFDEKEALVEIDRGN